MMCLLDEKKLRCDSDEISVSVGQFLFLVLHVRRGRPVLDANGPVHHAGKSLQPDYGQASV